jgi:hypothetical protein
MAYRFIFDIESRQISTPMQKPTIRAKSKTSKSAIFEIIIFKGFIDLSLYIDLALRMVDAAAH